MRPKIGLWLGCTILWSLVVGAVSLPTIEPDTTPSVPREFPNFNQNYTFVDNSSIRESLASHADIDTEVGDLLNKDVQLTKNVSVPLQLGTTPIPEVVTETLPLELHLDHEPFDPHKEDREDLSAQNVVEWIEDEDNSEDAEVIKTTDNTSTTVSTSEEIKETNTNIASQFVVVQESTTETLETLEPYKDGVPIINGTAAAILVGIFLVVCVAGYTALILWRRSLELKYGSREMLVDDDIFDPDDIKHFSI